MYNYSLLIYDLLDARVPPYQAVYASSDRRDMVPFPLRPNGQYRAVAATLSPGGRSANVTRDFAGVVGQSCVHDALAVSQIDYASLPGSASCHLAARCAGLNPAFLPQFNVTCAPATALASFWIWNLTLPSDASVAVNFTVQVGSQPAFSNLTNTSAFFLAATPPSAWAPRVQYSVAYAVPVTDYVYFEADWIPCEVQNWEAQVVPSLSSTYTVNFAWDRTAASSVCGRLRYAIRFIDGTPLVHVDDGCRSAVSVQLPPRCQPYQLTFNTTLAGPDGRSLGTPCLGSPHLPTGLYVRSPPQPPTLLAADVQKLEGVAVRWAPPAVLGGCSAYNYTLRVIDLYNGDAIFAAALGPDVTSYSVAVALRASGTFEVHLSCVTEAGPSVPSVLPFTTIPPAPGGGGLTPGALAGIVVGTFAGVALVIVLVWYVRRWQRYSGYHNM